MTPAEYANQHFQDFLEKLKNLVRIPSISFDGYPPEEVKRSAAAVASLLKEEGLENIEVISIDGAHPYVYADWLHAPGKPTLLLYAHHDVQPVGNLEKWKTKPFEPVEKDGRLYGRGAADDKAGIIAHTSAITSYLKTVGSLPINVKVLIEGEEEVGSDHLEGFLKKYKDKVMANAIILTDTGNYDTGIPTITTSLRGIVIVDVEVKTMDHSLHSGSWGGPIPDPVIALSKMIAKLVDDEGKIAIPGMHDNIRPLTAIEEKSLASLNFTESELRRQAQLLPGTQIIGGKDSALKKMTRLPSLAVNAIQASTRVGAANIINDSAWCRIGIRTVPDQDPVKVENLLKDFLLKNAPWGVKVEFTPQGSGNWWLTVPEGPVFAKAKAALEKAYGSECVFLGTGGSIPFVGPFAEVLGGAPALMIGVEDPYSNPHSENESLHLGDFKKAILSAIYLYEMMAEKG